MWISLLAIMVMLTGCVNGAWTRADTYRHAVLTTVMAVDYAQTMRIARNPDNYNEHNPILGKHPSELEVTGYFAAAYALSTVVATALPIPYRGYFQYIVIGIESVAVANNLSIGLGVGF